MAAVYIDHPGQFEFALLKFKQKVIKEGILREAKRRQAFVSNAESRRAAQAEIAKRNKKKRDSDRIPRIKLTGGSPLLNTMPPLITKKMKETPTVKVTR